MQRRSKKEPAENSMHIESNLHNIDSHIKKACNPTPFAISI